MKSKIVFVLGLTASLLTTSAPALAHHSNAIVDKDRLITVTGTVTRFAFAYPHVAVYFTVPDAQGELVQWYAAGNTPRAMATQAGWTNKTFTPGEQILVQGHPNRDDRPIMQFMRMYRCSGEPIPLDNAKTRAGEYLTRVELESISPERVRSVCEGEAQIPDMFGAEFRGDPE